MRKWLLVLMAISLVAALALSLAAPAWAGNGNGRDRPPKPTPPAQLGALVAELTPALAEKLGIQHQEGVVVIRVLPGSPAEKAGLLAKDIVTTVNGAAVKTPGELKKAVRDSEGEVTLTVVRGTETKQITVSVQEGFPPPRNPRRPSLNRPPHPLAWLRWLDELKGIPPGELFSHFLGGEFRITDKEGRPHTVRLVPGQVKEVTTSALTIVTNEGNQVTFTLDEKTKPQGLVQKLEPGAKVVVITVDGGPARAVVPTAAFKPHSFRGKPGRGAGERGD